MAPRLSRPMSELVPNWLFSVYSNDTDEPQLSRPTTSHYNSTEYSSQRSRSLSSGYFSDVNQYIPISTRGPYGEKLTSWLPAFATRGAAEDNDDSDIEESVESTEALSDCDCDCCRGECSDAEEEHHPEKRRVTKKERYRPRRRISDHSIDNCSICEESGLARYYSNDSTTNPPHYSAENNNNNPQHFPKEEKFVNQEQERPIETTQGEVSYDRQHRFDRIEHNDPNWSPFMKPHILNSIKDRIGRDSGEDLRYDDPYLSYHDVCLRKEDIDCLRDDWLTDNNIAFWEEFLEHEILSVYSDNKIYLLRPSMVFMILQTPDPRTLLSALPPMRQNGATHIFLPINDNKDPNIAEGGSHWSLLVIGVADGLAFHYDSLASSNTNEARKITSKMEQILGRRLNFVDLVDTPQQENSTDCGIHVCLNMRYLLVKRLLSATARDVVDMSLQGLGRKLDATNGRKEMYRIVSGLRRLAERSASPGDRKTGSPPRIE